MGILIILSSIISLRLGVSVTIIEILIGLIAGNLGIIQAESWMLYIASFGGILLTFLAGTEVDVSLFKNKFKESLLIGVGSFIAPFICILLISYFLIGWNLNASLLTATALSETSIAVVYSVLLETGLCNYEIGKLLMVATFITNLCTAIVLSLLFIQFNVYTVVFYAFSIIILVFCWKYSNLILNNDKLKDKLNEVEIKYIFVLLLLFIFLANLGGGQAILPSFILGILLSNQFKENGDEIKSKSRLKTVAFAVITPIFFIVGGMKVSLPLIIGSMGIFVLILVSRQIAKFIGVYTISSYYVSDKKYTALIMSTGLTFGLVAAVYGLNNGLISTTVYSIVTGVLVVSAILPTFIAEKWYSPKHTEDLNIN